MNRSIVAVIGAGILTFASFAAAADSLPAEGARVEVREGNIWSGATYVKKEGRKLQVRYDDGTEEWILPDRMRVPAGGAPADPAGETKGDTAAPGVSLDAAPIEVLMDNAPAARLSPGSPLRLKPTTRPAPAPTSFTRLTPVPAVAIEKPRKFIVCPDTPNLVVGLPERSDSAQQVLLIDLANPSRVEVRSIDGQRHEFIGVAEGGRLLLSKPAGDAVTVHIWEYDGQTYKPKANYTLASSKGGRRVRWASLQSPTRAVIGSDNDECFLVDLAKHRAIAMFKANASEDLQNGGSVISVWDNGTTGLVRAMDFTVVAQLKNIGMGGVVLDPTGTYAAFPAGGGSIRVIRATTGVQAGLIPGALRGGPMYLLSPDTVMVGAPGRVVFDVKTGMPLCEYVADGLEDAMLLPSGQILLAFRDGASMTLCLATMPDPRMVTAMRAANPQDFLLAPGAQVSITGDLSMFGADQKVVADSIQKVLAAAGHKLVNESSQFNLTFKLTPGPTGEFTYRERPRFGEPITGPLPIRRIPAPSSDLTVTLTRDGEPIWQQSFHFAAGMVVMPQGGRSIDQQVVEEGRPNVGALGNLAIPAYVPRGSTPGKPSAFRRVKITPDGFGAPEEPTAPPSDKNKSAPDNGDRPIHGGSEA